MAAENSDLLLKCLELTKHIVDRNMTCVINIKMGEGKSDFNYNFNNGLVLKKTSPSQEKRNFLRKQEHMKNKVKMEKELDEKEKLFGKGEIENNVNEKEGTEKKKFKTLKFKVAAHMRVAAEKVLETGVSKVSRALSQKIEWSKEESKFDLDEKVNGEFSGVHIFAIKISDEDPLEIILESVKKNWKRDPFPAELIQAWID